MGASSLTISLPAHVEFRLRGEAARRGIAAAQYASELIAEHLPPTTPQETEDGAPDEAPQRGVIAVESERELLFCQPMPLRLNELPRWRPQITISQRVIAENDDA